MHERWLCQRGGVTAMHSYAAALLGREVLSGDELNGLPGLSCEVDAVLA